MDRPSLKAILRRASKFIPWPTAIQRSIIKEQFERNYGIPDCIGLMDGCQVNLRAQPAREDARAFHNWKNKSGLLFVAIVDCDCAFATYNSDHPALSSDHRVQLFMNVFAEHRQYFSPSQYVLADSGFTATELCVSMFTKSARQSVLCGQAAYFDMKAAPHACQGGADIWLLKSRFPASGRLVNISAAAAIKPERTHSSSPPSSSITSFSKSTLWNSTQGTCSPLKRMPTKEMQMKSSHSPGGRH